MMQINENHRNRLKEEEEDNNLSHRLEKITDKIAVMSVCL